jgi:hypothetical protein
MYNKYLKSFMSVLLTAVIITGCSSSDINVDKANISDIIEQAKEDKTVTSSGDNIDVNAEVNVTDSNYKTYNFSFLQFDADNVANILLKDKSLEKETISSNEGGISNVIHHYGATQDKSKEYDEWELLSGESLTVTTADLSYILYKTPLSDLVHAFFNPIFNVYDFAEESLDFATPNEAIEIAIEALNKLGLSVNNLPEIIAIDAESANLAMERYRNDNIYNFNTFLYPDSFSVSDECYYMIFNATIDNVSVYNKGFEFKSIPGFYVSHPEICVVVSKIGVEYLKVENPAENFEAINNVDEVISVEAATAAVMKKYSEIITGNAITFENISLMYVFIPVGNSSDLIASPAWVFEGSEVSEKAESIIKFKTVVLIDAITGQEIK